MKHRSFEDFLMDYHCKHNPTVLDDELPEAFDDWIADMCAEDWIHLGDKYLKEQIGGE